MGDLELDDEEDFDEKVVYIEILFFLKFGEIIVKVFKRFGGNKGKI